MSLNKLFDEIYFRMPLSQNVKNALLARAEEALSRYKPKIEERTGIDLGDLTVADSKYSVAHSAQKIIDTVITDDISPFQKHLRYAVVNGIYRPIVKLAHMMKDWSSFHYYDSTIYMTFGDHTKALLLECDRNVEDFPVDQGVVHETLHHLWFILGGDKICGGNYCSPNGRLWYEGFPTYGHEIWFADLYPENYRIREGEEDSVHQLGKRRVEALVKVKGEKVLLEIPTKWPEFEQDMQL